MDFHWKPRWDDWHTAQSLRENKLVCFGLYAGYLAEQGKIKLPSGLQGEDAIASLGIAVVNAFEHPDTPDFDEPFDCFCIDQLIQYFGVKESE